MSDDPLAILPVEDFWGRRAHAPRYTFECAPYGAPATISSNAEAVLAAARLSARRYSHAPTRSTSPLRIQCSVRETGPAEGLPANLPDRLIYSGVGPWLTLTAGDWGQGFANLDTGEAQLFLAPQLAVDTRLVSRYFIDHYVLNLVLADWAMLHASCVLDPSGERLIILVAPHNSGKSTTALYLTRCGYTFLADGLALIQEQAGELVVGGYPIGEVKLRDDVLTLFPEYAGEAVKVREHTKTIIDLRAAHPERVSEAIVRPAAIHVCFVERRAVAETCVEAMPPGAARDWVAANTVFWDEPQRLRRNSAILQHLFDRARLHRLYLGRDTEQLIATIERLR